MHVSQIATALPQLGCLTVLILLAGQTNAEEPAWGRLSGRFLFEGTPPAAKRIEVTKDREFFAEFPLRDESLLVDPKSRGVTNLLVYLLPEKGKPLPVHPSYDRSAKATVELSMQKGRFEPHVVLLRTSQTLLQRNDDEAAHSANIRFLRNPPK